MDGGAWWAAVHGVTKSQTWLSDFTFTVHCHALEKEMATHSSVLAWRIPGTAEPSGLPSLGSHRVGHDWSDLAVAAATTYSYETGGGGGGLVAVKSHSCKPMDCSLRVSSVQGILQATILEWVAIFFSRVFSQPRQRIHISCTSSIAGRFFTNWASREAVRLLYIHN